MKFGDNLKKVRILKKLSQEDLAQKVKVSRQSVSKCETGDAYPTMNNLLELCKIFHCKINDLVEILFLFSLSYIFEYGRLLGFETKGKMYGVY